MWQTIGAYYEVPLLRKIKNNQGICIGGNFNIRIESINLTSTSPGFQLIKLESKVQSHELDLDAHESNWNRHWLLNLKADCYGKIYLMSFSAKSPGSHVLMSSIVSHNILCTESITLYFRIWRCSSHGLFCQWFPLHGSNIVGRSGGPAS